ncbi:hypothetical protein CARUB_v10015051mg [Capsella rubella]|uniref:Uncharacterized protein n=1 Tax=Capsella rubella TaxID=81985 RepID=R0G866_9BRAS|nr:hypothetical protein CARUB_v10015051mg [Capsella rubella]
MFQLLLSPYSTITMPDGREESVMKRTTLVANTSKLEVLTYHTCFIHVLFLVFLNQTTYQLINLAIY